jgi:hypothetical protein
LLKVLESKRTLGKKCEKLRFFLTLGKLRL